MTTWTQTRRLTLLALAAVPLAVGPAPRAVEWPMVRYDRAQTGVSPGRGRMTRPRVVWEHYLGAPETALVARLPEPDPWRADLDSDGMPEQVVAGYGQPARVVDGQGKTLWSAPAAATSSPELTRVGTFIPGRKGRQLLVFTSRMDTGAGEGYLFAFDQGASRGEIVWRTGPLAGYYAPTLIVDDVDGDGHAEVVTAPHYRLEIRDAATGRLEAEVPISRGRNYGILLARACRDLPRKDLYVVSDFVLHVECVRFAGRRWSHAWGHKYLEDENAPSPRGRERYLRVGPNPVLDLDGDGRDEVAYGFVEPDGKGWRLRVRDSETGNVRADLPGVWLWSLADLDGDGRAEVIYTPTNRMRPPTWCELRVARFDGTRLVDRAALPRVKPLLTRAALPPSIHSMADEGMHDLLRADVDGDDRPELFVALPARGARYADRLRALSLQGKRLRIRWQLSRPGRRLDLAGVEHDPIGHLIVRVRDLTAGRELWVNARGRVTREADLGRPGGFSTVPIVADLDGDGAGEIIRRSRRRRPPGRLPELRLLGARRLRGGADRRYTPLGRASPHRARL